MRQNKQDILVTRPLSGRQIEYARILGLRPVVREALSFEFPTYWDEVLKVVNEYSRSDWVFTSRNGARALQRMMERGLNVRPETRVFAVGKKTRDALSELGVEATIPDEQNAEHLARLIVDEGKKDSVIYFHGNLRRDELPDRLTEENIEVIELEVYKTIINEVQLPARPIEAVLFYSPSAVKAFERGTGFDRDLPLLCAIGPTTAEAIRSRASQEPVVAEEPSTEALLQAVAQSLFEKEER